MTHEYLQMGGRAGRRGIDKEGLVILLPNLGELPNVHVMNNLINGEFTDYSIKIYSRL